MLQLGFVSAILPELSLDEVLAVAAEIGYDCVEVMCWPQGKAERRYAGITHIDTAALGPAEVDAIGALTQKHGVAISGLGYYPNPLAGDLDEAAAMEAKQAAEEAISDREGDMEIAEAQAKLAEAVAQLHMIEKMRNRKR